MPHIIVEHTKAISDSVDMKNFNERLHHCLSTQETVKLESIKTRSVQVDNTIVGDGSSSEFVHINILLLAGRSDELKQDMANNIFDVAQKALSSTDCLLSVNVDELGVYKK